MPQILILMITDQLPELLYTLQNTLLIIVNKQLGFNQCNSGDEIILVDFQGFIEEDPGSLPMQLQYPHTLISCNLLQICDDTHGVIENPTLITGRHSIHFLIDRNGLLEQPQRLIADPRVDQAVHIHA